MKLAALAALAVFVTPATGAPNCDRHDRVKAVLLKKFDEHRTIAGVTGDDDLMEIFQTRSGATWTIVITTPYGRACIVDSGESLIEFEIEKKGEKL